jgi:hypothetical protein
MTEKPILIREANGGRAWHISETMVDRKTLRGALDLARQRFPGRLVRVIYIDKPACEFRLMGSRGMRPIRARAASFIERRAAR